MDADSSDLASRRGRPTSEYGALFPDGRLWRWIVGLAYAGLVVLEVIGDRRWRDAATPYLDISLFIGLIPTVWWALRPRTQHERNAEARAAMASLSNAPLDAATLADAGLLDENGKLLNETPPAWLDELTPEPARRNTGRLIVRAILTPALAFAAWVGLLFGLAIVDWARGYWIIATPIAAVLVGIVWLARRKRSNSPEGSAKSSISAGGG